MLFAASRERIVHLPSALPLMKENVNKHGPEASKQLSIVYVTLQHRLNFIYSNFAKGNKALALS
jgi:hypothetical protein